MGLDRFGPLLLAALLLTGCTGSDDATRGAGEPLHVTAAFYPLAYLTSQIGGARVEVTNLTTPGTEPHDLELTPDNVVGVVEAELVVYLSSFQPAVDDAVGQADTDRTFDVARSADLGRHDGDAVDPHFWLDPKRFGEVAEALAERLAEVDPDGATTYRANVERLAADLATLDADFRAGLDDCASTDLVTSHSAFGYLADRYGLTQHGIAGITPDAEPDPAAIADATDFVEERGVTTIFFETLVSPAVAEAVASETGARTAVLDPIEGLTDDSQGDDYLSVMRSNLSSLETGLSCG